MTRASEIQKRVVKIRVRVQVGDNLLAATDDPLFLGLRGDDGREFRLLLEDSYRRLSGWLVTGVVHAPTATHLLFNENVYVFVMAGNLGEGFRSKLVRGSDPGCTDSLRSLYAHLGDLLS